MFALSRTLSRQAVYLTMIASLAILSTPARVAFAQVSTVIYSEVSGDIVNPDRGFYYPYTTTVSQFTPLDISELKSRCSIPYTPFQSNYTVLSSLAFRHYVLDSLATVDTIPADVIDKIQADFDIAREAGVRLILRFFYTITPNSGNCSAGFICPPPYGEAPKTRVLQHIQQLKPVLNANYEVISSIQQGFVGTWGENYYSDHFGDPSVNANLGYLTDQNWLDRSDVVGALLDSTPINRMLQVRYPQVKQRYLGGVNLPIISGFISLLRAR